MSPVNLIFPAPPPLTDLQKHALSLYIRKKRAHYEKADAVISRKYKWLEDLNQIDPDLEGIEISESSLEELKKKRENLCEEKHALFEKVKNILPEEEESHPPPQATQPGYPISPSLSYPLPVHTGYQPPYVTTGYPPPPPSGGTFHSTPYTPYVTAPHTPYSTAPYSVITEPITPKKPSEMSPVHGEGPVMRPLDMSPISSHERSSYSRNWDNISPVNKPPRNWDNISPVNKPPDPSDHFNKPPDPKFTSEYATPSAATKYAETRETRIDSFTKAFTDTISKAMMSELNMSLGSATKAEETSVAQPPVKPAEPPTRPDSLLSPKHKPKAMPEAAPLPKTPEAVRKHEPKTPEMGRRGEGYKTPDVRRVEHVSGKSRKSVSGTESNSSVSSKHLSQSPHAKRKEEVSDLPPVIKISKAEIHSKVMSWPTSHPFQRKPGDRTTPDVEKKPAGKKESADSSGSSLLEFAFQSALFGNTLFNEKDASPTVPQGPKTPPPAPSDLLTALSMSYGGGPPRKHDKPSDDRKELEKSRKRERSPDARSPSPELVQVYKPEKEEEKKEEEKGKEEEKKTTPPPPPPPPPPPKSTPPAPGCTKKVVASPATPTMGYTPCSPSTSPAVPPSVPYSPAVPPSVPYSSFHSPISFISPTHLSQYPTSQYSSPILPHKSPIRSPMMNPYTSPGYHPPATTLPYTSPGYHPPATTLPYTSPGYHPPATTLHYTSTAPPIGMLPPPPVQPPMAGLPPPMAGLPPPHMPPLPPPHLLHPPHKNRSYPSNRYM